MDESKRLSQLRLSTLAAIRKHLDFDRNDPGWRAAHELTRLLGYTDYGEIIRDTDKIKHILEGLAGPHGLTIYKMLKLRQEKPNDG